MNLVQKTRISFIVLTLLATILLFIRAKYLNDFKKLKQLEPNLDFYFSERDSPFDYKQDIEVMLNTIKKKSIIFVGGFARSGTTLMRAILDSHPMIRCGPESKILPPFLSFIASWKSNEFFLSQLSDASINKTIFYDSTVLFLYHMIAMSGPEAIQLCLKDPLILEHINMINFLLPKSKFIFVVRDPRASILSMAKLFNVRMNDKYFLSSLKDWNSVVASIDSQCTNVGSANCHRVKYEDLVLSPNRTLKSLFTRFLHLPWSQELLRHEKQIGKRVRLSKSEWSSSQIIRPVHNGSLYLWHDYERNLTNITLNVVEHLAPMFKKFGYNINEKTYHKLIN